MHKKTHGQRSWQEADDEQEEEEKKEEEWKQKQEDGTVGTTINI